MKRIVFQKPMTGWSVNLRLVVSLLVFLFTLITFGCDRKTESLAAVNIGYSLQEIINSTYEVSGVASISGAVILPNEQVISFFAGHSNIGDGVQVDANTTFLAGSVGKTFVSAVIFRLNEQGFLSLDDNIVKWLSSEPWFHALPESENITIRHLLYHTSGIPSQFSIPGIVNFYADFFSQHPLQGPKPREILSKIDPAVIFKKPGEHFEYSDLNYLLLGLVIEAATDRSFYNLVNEFFIVPLNLDDIFTQDGPVIPRLAAGYLPSPYIFDISSPTVVNGKMVYDPSFEWTGGGFASTPKDLARWIWYLFSGEALGDVQVSAMLKSPSPFDSNSNFYGAGVEIYNNFPIKAIGHSGAMPGYKSLAVYIPSCDIAIAVQVNDERQEQNVRVEIVTKIMRLLSGYERLRCDTGSR